ncbi:MAG TPA: LCP family protein [Candidatus Saccharimonadales bacterium]|nr:LCP family protein [Candidatus Saccharimonadales bacterium]
MNSRQNKDRRPRRFSIDGVSPRPVRTGGSIGFDGRRPRRPAVSGKRLDDFRKPEGFDSTTVRNSPIGFPARQHFAAEDKPRGLFGRFKKRGRSKRLDSYEKKARRKKKLKIAGIVFLILLAIFAFLVAKGYINLRKVFGGGGSAAALEQNVDPSKLNVEGDGRVNILLLGRGGLGHDGADLTDTIILVSIDPIAREAGMVSVPRDLYVSVPDIGSMKINSVFYTGKTRALNATTKRDDDTKREAETAGMNLVDRTIEEILGIPVHYHAMVDFSGFKQAIDTVGGIDVNVPKRVRETMWIDRRNYVLDVRPGMQHMGGFEALAYARSRHTAQRGDFDRAERQRLIILALKDKILSLGTFSNPAKLSTLIDQFGNHVQSNFSTGDVNKLYSLAQRIESSKVKSIGLADPPNDFVKTAYIGGLSVVIPSAGLDNYSEIHYYIRNTLKDSFLKMENAGVMVLNGTDRSGLAKDKAQLLKSYGYRVVKAGNAPTRNYAKTVIIDLKHGDKKYTRHYLEKRFKVLSTNNLGDASINTAGADFVIILGNDISSG